MTPAEKRSLIVAALVAKDWNVSQAARLLGVHRQALQRDVRQWGGAVALRNEWESVAPATCVAHATIRECDASGECNAKSNVALTYGERERTLADVNSVALTEAEAKSFKSTTLPLDREEWLFLRRRAEREADLGGDSSLRGAIKALIRAEMERERKDEEQGR